jgi:hypothetical protein
MPAQAGIHDFGRIDPQAVDGRNKPGHDGKRTPMGHSQGPLILHQCLGTYPLRHVSVQTLCIPRIHRIFAFGMAEMPADFSLTNLRRT